MCRPDDPAAREAAAWLDAARRLVADGELPAAVAAYERMALLVDRDAAEAGCRITVLGGFEVSVAGRPVDLSGLRPQHRALLQVFAVHADRVLSDRRLCAWFWPDADPEAARHRLAVGVSAIRTLLAAAGGTQLVRTSEGYRLRLDGDATDAGRFERLLVTARAARRDERLPRLESALAAYRDALLPAVDAEWVLAERDRLQNLALGAAVDLAEAHARAGRFVDTVRVARIGLGHDRTCDRLWRRLVGALTEIGEPAAAATARRQYTEVLADLGVVAWPTTGRRLRSA